MPTSFVAGDTVAWREEFPDYPASSGWALTLYFTGPSTFNAAGVADGAAFDVTITAANSTKYSAGIYSYQLCVTKTTERYTLREGQIEIKTNLAAIAAGYDARSHARKTLEKIETALENYATNPVQSLTIAGRTYENPGVAELLKLKSHYQSLVAAEDAAERVSRGLGSGKRILVRFP